MTEKTPPNWNPEPWERIYYRHATSGDLGYVVRRDGIDVIRLDRPHQEIISPMDEKAWVREASYTPVSHVQVVMIAFEADRMLLKSLGEHRKAMKTFHELTEKQRKAWLCTGPLDPPKRAQLYKAILECLEGPPCEV